MASLDVCSKAELWDENKREESYRAAINGELDSPQLPNDRGSVGGLAETC
jgi:hypothetical protein